MSPPAQAKYFAKPQVQYFHILFSETEWLLLCFPPCCSWPFRWSIYWVGHCSSSIRCDLRPVSAASLRPVPSALSLILQAASSVESLCCLVIYFWEEDRRDLDSLYWRHPSSRGLLDDASWESHSARVDHPRRWGSCCSKRGCCHRRRLLQQSEASSYSSGGW